MVVRDADDEVFGAWIGEGIRMNVGSYYGGGDAFLWRVEHEGLESARVGNPKDEKIADDGTVVLPQLKVWKWTGRNDYVALCETDSISLGGGYV